MAKKTQPKNKNIKKVPAKKQSNNYAGYIIAILLAIIFYFYSSNFNFIQDDSYITYRYVKNFTEGNGMVFNLGEHVEGYTNFLWVIIISVVKIIGFNFIKFSQLFGILASLLSIIFTYKISSEIFAKDGDNIKSAILNNIAPLILIANGAFAYWTVSGMETGLFVFLITLGIYYYLKELRTNQSINYSSLIFLLAALTRPEGVLIFIITLLHRIFHAVKFEKRTGGIKEIILSRKFLIWLGMFIIPGAIYMIWRVSYFGYLLPNTFYAKTGSSLEYFKAGFDYFLDFAKIYGLYGVLILIALYNFFVQGFKSERIYLLTIFLIFTLYVIMVSGDVLRPSRFFLPVVPVLAILVQEGMISISNKFNKNKTGSSLIIPIAAALVIAYITYNVPYADIKKFSEMENGLTEKMKITGNWLKNKQTQSGKKLTVAATTIGAISYFSETTLIDMLGLTDHEIAHNPKPIPEISENAEIGWKERQYNVDYVISRKPDYIYFSTGMKPSAYAERGLFTNDEFMKYYYPYYFTMKEYGFTECIYKRKSDDEALTFKQIDNPNYKKSYVNLFNQAINTSRDKSKLDEALNLHLRTIEAAPGNFSQSHQQIGDIYQQKKNIDKAIEYYRKAIEIDEYNVMAHINLYQLLAQKGDKEGSNKSLEILKKIAPELL